MTNPQAAKRASQEQYFFEYVDQLDRHRAHRLALVVTLSGIDTARARQSTQNLVSDHIRHHMGAQSYQMFTFERGDVAVLTKDVASGFMEDMAFGLVYQLKDEDFFAAFENGESDLCRLLDVETDYTDLKTYAKAGLHKGPIGLPGQPMASLTRDDIDDDDDTDTDVVDAGIEPLPEAHEPNEDQRPDNLSATYVDLDFGKEEQRPTRDANAELETIREEIIQINSTDKPEIVMSRFAADKEALLERFLEYADDETRDAYLPGILQEAEQRLIDFLTQDDPHLLPKKMVIAVQVKTLLSGSFLNFDRMRASMSVLPRSILVLGRDEIRADGETFKFAREFVEGRGHQVGLKGLKILSLGKVRLRASGFVLQFVEWDAFDASLITKKEKAVLRAGVKDAGSAATVLTGCHDDEALEFGKSIGIELFEGRAAVQALFHVDHTSSSE